MTSIRSYCLFTCNFETRIVAFQLGRGENQLMFNKFAWLSFFRKQKLIDHSRRLDAMEVRLEAIGGQGANSAGKILAEAAVIGMGYSGQHFSSFGSEKRGSPVKSFVRFYRDRRMVRASSPVLHPDILVIFHEALMAHNPEVLDGTDETRSVVLVNSSLPPGRLEFPEAISLNLVASVDASEISDRLGSGLNAVLLGAMAPLCPEIEISKLEAALMGYFKNLPPEKCARIRAGFYEGRAAVKLSKFKAKRAHLERPVRALPKIGWENAPIGGVITNPGNTMLRDLSASRRGTVPALNRELCIQCGLCDMVCPDFCFVWEFDEVKAAVPVLKGIDYQYCKGCQKCVVVCPMNALTVTDDTPEFVLAHRVPRFSK
jgi:pyruvate ferredoxin oxidoreductase gamma subunit